MPIVWTDELKERVKGLWETNSATQIAALLNGDGYAVSRAAISGVINRMGLTSKNKTEDHPSACDRNRATPRAAKVVSQVVDLFAGARARESLLGPANVRGINALESHHCRNPLNDDMSDPLFCGRVKADGKSFCPACCARLFLPREERRAAA